MGRSEGEPGDPAWAAGTGRQRCPCPQQSCDPSYSSAHGEGPSTKPSEHGTALATHGSLWLPPELTTPQHGAGVFIQMAPEQGKSFARLAARAAKFHQAKKKNKAQENSDLRPLTQNSCPHLA